MLGWIVHVPRGKNRTMRFDTVHTVGVVGAKGDHQDDPGDCASVWFAIAAKAIDCASLARISTTDRFHRSVTGAVSLTVTSSPWPRSSRYAPWAQKVSVAAASSHWWTSV